MKIIAVCIVGWGVVFLGGRAEAESVQAMALQKSVLYGDHLQVADEDKQQYLAGGQTYLRNLLREQMLNTSLLRWFNLDSQTMQAGIEVGMNDFYEANTMNWDMRMRIFADEEIQHYYQCGRFLPIRMEMDSSYLLLPNLKVQAKVHTPLNDFMQIQLGSQIDWSSQMNSVLQYRLNPNQQRVDSMTLGLGYTVMDWRWKVFYEINANLGSMQYFSLATDF